ncbi:hypothetical protein A2U01_0103129, partial [Trifolium medium]|nr:hypothetical protein [Trifolium medium]
FRWRVAPCCRGSLELVRSTARRAGEDGASRQSVRRLCQEALR